MGQATPRLPRVLFGVSDFYEVDFDERSSLLRFCIYGCWPIGQSAGAGGASRSDVVRKGDGTGGTRTLQGSDENVEAHSCEWCGRRTEEESGIAGSTLCHDDWRPGERRRSVATFGKDVSARSGSVVCDGARVFRLVGKSGAGVGRRCAGVGGGAQTERRVTRVAGKVGRGG